MALQVRRGLEADRLTIIPQQGELLYTTDNKRLYVGDNSTLGGTAVGSSSEEIQDISASLLTSGTHNGITFSYDDNTNAINATVTATGYSWSIAGDDSSLKPISSGESVKFRGTGGITVVVDVDGNVVTIDGSGVAGGGGGSGTITSGFAGQLAVYPATGTTLVGTQALGWDEATGTLYTTRLDTDSIVSNSSTFSIFNTNNETITLGGTFESVEYSGFLNTIDVGGFDPTTASNNRFISIHNDSFTNLSTFIRQRGTLAAPTKIQAFDVIGGLGFVGYDGSGFRGLGNLTMFAATTPVTGSGIIPGIMAIQTANNAGNMATAFTLDSTQSAEFFGDVTLSKNFSNGTISISNNVISTIVSNADLELRTNGTGAIFLDTITINTNTIDTSDSSGITFVPTATFNSEVFVENDLRVTNRAYAQEFVSTSTGAPEIGSTNDVTIRSTNKFYIFQTDGGFKMTALTAAPSGVSGSIYLADGINWDPDTKGTNKPYPVFFDGTSFNALY